MESISNEQQFLLREKKKSSEEIILERGRQHIDEVFEILGALKPDRKID